MRISRWVRLTENKELKAALPAGKRPDVRLAGLVLRRGTAIVHLLCTLRIVPTPPFPAPIPPQTLVQMRS